MSDGGPNTASTATPPRRTLGRRGMLLMVCVVALVGRLTLFLRQRSPESYSHVDTEALSEIVIVALTLGVLIASAPPLLAAWEGTSRRSVRLFLLYFVYGVTTAAFALNPQYAFFRAIECLSQALAVLVLFTALARFRDAERLALGLAWGVLLLEAFGRWRLGRFEFGDLSSNSMSASAAMLACYCGGEALEARGSRRMALIVSGAGALGLLILGMSLASWWALVAGLVLAGMVLRPTPAVGVALLLLVLASAGWGQDLMDRVLLRNRELASLTTLHGRTLFWQFYWDAFLEQPWLGYGYAVGARLKGIAYTTHTHNAVLSALLGVGIPGLVLLAGVFVRFAREVFRSRSWGTPGWVGCAAAITCGLVNSMAFALVGEGWMPPTLVFTTFLVLHHTQVLRPPKTSRRPILPVSRPPRAART